MSLIPRSKSFMCAIAFAFIGGMLWLVIAANRTVINNFTKNLDVKQMKIMEEIKKMRFQLWIRGLFFGFIIALLAARFLPVDFGGENSNACAIAAIAMGINYFYYMFSSKPIEMIDYLRPDQIEDWKLVKNEMQFKYHVGIVLGLVGSFLLTKGLSNYDNSQIGG